MDPCNCYQFFFSALPSLKNSFIFFPFSRSIYKNVLQFITFFHLVPITCIVYFSYIWVEVCFWLFCVLVAWKISLNGNSIPNHKSVSSCLHTMLTISPQDLISNSHYCLPHNSCYVSSTLTSHNPYSFFSSLDNYDVDIVRINSVLITCWSQRV